MGPEERTSVSQRSYDIAWQTTAQAIAGRRLRGLQIRCPVCGHMGTVFSKWIPGPPIKPLYVVHSNGKGYFRACSLSKDQASHARSTVSITYEDIRKTLRMGQPYLLFSGGKDSLCLLEYMRKICESINAEVTVIHADTTAGFPEVEAYVKNVSRRLSLKLVTVRPPRNFFGLAKRWGIPGVKSRWCCETLKIAPIRRYLSQIEGPKVVYDGIRAAESHVRATYIPVWYHPSFSCISVSPIFRWSDRKVENYIAKNSLPKSPATTIGTSAECWCGAYKCRKDFEILLDVHPEIFDKLVEVERAQRGKYTFLYEGGKRIPLAILKKGKTNSKKAV